MSGKIFAPNISTGLNNDPNDATNKYGDVTATTSGNKRGLDVMSVGSLPMACAIDEASATVTYVGKAAIGTATNAASWQVQKITVSGTVTTVTWADGNANFDNVWDNRASLSYS